jgi:hypothetical protein
VTFARGLCHIGFLSPRRANSHPKNNNPYRRSAHGPIFRLKFAT